MTIAGLSIARFVEKMERSGSGNIVRGEMMDTDLLWLAKMRMKDEKEYSKFMESLAVVVKDMVKLQSKVDL